MSGTSYSIPNSSYSTAKPELDFTVYFSNSHVALQILLVAVSVVAVLLNALLLIATSQVKSKRKNYFCLVQSLILADLLLSLSSTVYPITQAFDVRDNWTGLVFFIRRSIHIGIYNSLTCAVAVNLIMIALDCYIAIIHPLRYITFVTSRKIHVSLIFVWLFSLLCGFSCFFTAVVQKIFYYPAEDYLMLALRCTDNTGTYHTQLIVVSIVQFTCVLVLLVIYTRICVEICKLQRFEQDQALMRSEEYKQGKKGVLTSLFIIGTYLILAVPEGLYLALVISQTVQYNATLDGILGIFNFLNCICDPIIHTLRLTEVRNTIKQICIRN